MTTMEATIGMMNNLSDSELMNVQGYIERIFAYRKAANKPKPVTKADFVKSIKKSKQNIKDGRVKSWAQVRAETHEKYGL